MKNKKKNSRGNNSTECGEFVCSYNHWLPIEEQKKQADKMDKMTKEKNN